MGQYDLANAGSDIPAYKELILWTVIFEIISNQTAKICVFFSTSNLVNYFRSVLFQNFCKYRNLLQITFEMWNLVLTSQVDGMYTNSTHNIRVLLKVKLNFRLINPFGAYLFTLRPLLLQSFFTVLYSEFKNKVLTTESWQG